jgi:hypothetical protein
MVLWLGFAYLGVMMLLLALENWFLFHPETAAERWDAPRCLVQDIDLKSADGTALHAWWMKPQDWNPDHGALLFLHGNAGNLSDRGESMCRLRDELRLAVLIVDYPGYGKSQGSPSEKGCNLAGEAAYEWLTDEAKVPGKRVVLIGVSLGASVATHLATLHPYRALVLMAAFTSFPDMAQKTFPWLPARWLVRNQMNNLARIPTLKRPVFIIHSSDDALIPYSMGERLFAAANEPKRFFALHDRPHDEYLTDECLAALKAFLNETDIATA